MPVGQFSILLIETLGSDASAFKKLSTADILQNLFYQELGGTFVNSSLY